jgi:hypothetical protein
LKASSHLTRQQSVADSFIEMASQLACLICCRLLWPVPY